VLLSLLVLPLYTPILIFGAGAVTASATGLDPEAYLSLLGAFLAVALGFAPGPRPRRCAYRWTEHAVSQIRFAKGLLRPRRQLIPWFAIATLILLGYGLYQAVRRPTDYQQGESVRIMFIHVPAAWMSMFVYMVMASAGAIGLIWNMRLADMAATASAPIGRLVYAAGTGHGLTLGKTDVGHLVGVGRTPHFRTAAVLPVSRLHGPASGDRRTAARGARRCAARAGRRGQYSGDPFLGAVVEHPASTGLVSAINKIGTPAFTRAC